MFDKRGLGVKRNPKINPHPKPNISIHPKPKPNINPNCVGQECPTYTFF